MQDKNLKDKHVGLLMDFWVWFLKFRFVSDSSFGLFLGVIFLSLFFSFLFFVFVDVARPVTGRLSSS